MFDHPLTQTWQLEMFPGGSDSAAFRSFLLDIEEKSARLKALVSAETKPADLDVWSERIALTQWLKGALMEADSFIGCLEAQNQNDKEAQRLNGRLQTMNAEFTSILSQLDGWFLLMDDNEWDKLLLLEAAKGGRFWLQERRRLASEKLSPEMESLISALAVDGYHAWGNHYQTAVGRIQLNVTDEHGQLHTYSAGQAANQFHHPDHEVRKEIFRLWEEAWEEQADICSAAINHLAGFRIRVYEQRGWHSVLQEPLAINRMSEQTLNTIWAVIHANKQPFVNYLHRKAELIGVEKLHWYDLEAPISPSVKRVEYDKAASLIVEQFARFNPDLSRFAKTVFENRWVEAENRSAKRPGGFCTSFPLSGETRIFMTYGGTTSNVSTLAHELGHAYHQHVMKDLPILSQDYAMNVAETASTFAELIVADAAVREADNDQERIILLEEKIQSSVAYFMNIHARYLFETSFYEERSHGLVSTERLKQIMEEAQRQAYCDELASYHPYFWAAKLHFYLTDVPFYNFPYTFGYLFSAGIYARAIQEGPAFTDKYISLLRDTASMSVEELAAKHLGVDLQQPDFWQSAIDMTIKDVEMFLQLTEK